MALSGLLLCIGLVVCSQLCLQALGKRTQVHDLVQSIETAVDRDGRCCKHGCFKGTDLNAVPFCASSFPRRLWLHGLFYASLDDSMCYNVTTGYEFATAMPRGGACDAGLAETKLGFSTGENVRWIKSDADIPVGAIGTVVGFGDWDIPVGAIDDRGGEVEVSFPKGTWRFPPAQLLKVPTPETIVVSPVISDPDVVDHHSVDIGQEVEVGPEWNIGLDIVTLAKKDDRAAEAAIADVLTKCVSTLGRDTTASQDRSSCCLEHCPTAKVKLFGEALQREAWLPKQWKAYKTFEDWRLAADSFELKCIKQCTL